MIVILSTIGQTLKKRGVFSSINRESPPIHYVDLLGDNPINIRPGPIRGGVEFSRDDLRRYAAVIAESASGAEEPEVRSRAVHVCRLWRFIPSLPRWYERDDRGVIDHVLIAAPAFSLSWRGLEMAEKANHERGEHRDQMLATLAALGVPLSAKLDCAKPESVKNTGAGAKYTVRDLLRTSMNEFHLKQREIEWTAVAYARYLPPQSRWKNRLGETYSFDLLAGELMRRPLNGNSCRGIHLLAALTTVLLCDHEKAVLSAKMRDSITAHLKRYVDAAVASQQPDGSWPLRWAPIGYFHEEGNFTPKASLESSVVVLGHLLEWFHWLPADLKPPEATVRAGLAALSSKLKMSPRELINKEFCPYTHALTALFLAGPI